MPIRTDAEGRRWVEMELIVPGAPEQVWQAIATGPGTTAWFTRTTIEQTVGGRIAFDFGPNGSSAGEVTAYAPHSVFAYVERDWSKGAPPVATEIAVRGRSGDRCVIRMVHTLVAASDEWDEQLEGFESGWHGFFEVLRLYLAHFAGRPAAMFTVAAQTDSGQAQVWTRLTEALGLAAAHVGEDRRTPDQPQCLAGTVARVVQGERERYLLLRLSEPDGIALIGTYGEAGAAAASMSLYLYGDDAERRAEASALLWRSWLEGLSWLRRSES